jgi:dipeptidase E
MKLMYTIFLLLTILLIIVGILFIKTGDKVPIKAPQTQTLVKEKTWETELSNCSLLNQNKVGSNLKLYLGGSGDDMFSQEQTAKEVINLAGKSNPNVLYIGTCSYDAYKPKHLQTHQFKKLGCNVRYLDVTHSNPGINTMKNELLNTDIIVISGGNTLWGRDRWVKIGLDKLIKDAVMKWGKVWAGGSAGMILATDGGHSDSMDPSTYLNPPGPLMSSFTTQKQLDSSWAYIRAPGLGIIPMIACPHYDKIESNGALRATSFEKMMKMHSGEYALVIDNWAGIMINGDKYQLVKRQGKSGSVGPNGEYTSNPKIGKPGAWTIEIDPITGFMIRNPVSEKGFIGDISKSPRYIVESQMIKPARKFNPQ